MRGIHLPTRNGSIDVVVFSVSKSETGKKKVPLSNVYLGYIKRFILSISEPFFIEGDFCDIIVPRTPRRRPESIEPVPPTVRAL